MKGLVEGYKRFRNSYWQEHHEAFGVLAVKGQSPRAAVIACCDSRVPPELIFDTAPGEIFVVRNVANLVPPYAPDCDYHGTSAALEFAVRKLQVEQIIVMGHTQCGGIHALVQGADAAVRDFIGPWMDIAAEACERSISLAGGDIVAARTVCEYESIRVSLKNLLSFPWIKGRVDEGVLQLHGCVFNVETGELAEV